jgi:hypothetical protein
MKNQIVFLVAFVSLTLLSLNSCTNNDNSAKDTVKNVSEVQNEVEGPQYLAVMSGKSGSYDGEKLTLQEVPMVMYFSDRPWRIAGKMAVEKFIVGWKKNYSDLETDPPNAILSILNEDGTIINVVVELLTPEFLDGAVHFYIKILDGVVPEKMGSTSLFIDPINQNGQWTGT